MKKLKTLIVIVTLLFLPTLAQAQTSHLMHFQGVLVDEGGNVLYDVQEADIVFSIVDGSGEVLFSERQHLVLVGGATAALIGRGERISGDDLIDIFDTPGDKLLRIQVEGYPIPQEEAQIVHVPYAMIAERLSSDVTSAMIANGAIQQVDLSEELLSYIDNLTGLTEGDLDAHRSESGAHTAVSISVENTFVNMPGTNLQQILQGVDTAITIRANQDDVLQDNIDAEARAREEADTEEARARIAGDAALDAAKVNRAGDTMTGDLSFDDAACLANPLLGHNCQVDGVDVSDLSENVSSHTSSSSGVHGVSGNVVGTTDSQTLTNKTLGGTTMSGNITMNDEGCGAQGSGIVCLTVDRVDVSGLQDRVADLEETSVRPEDIPDTAQLAFAWARVDVSSASLERSCMTTTGIVSSHNITCAVKLDTGRYGLRFDEDNQPSSANYAVIGTAYGGADRVITIGSMTGSGFVVDIWEIAAEYGNHDDADFMVVVYGGE